MKRPCLSACLLISLLGAGQAGSASPTPPSAPSAPSAPHPGDELKDPFLEGEGRTRQMSAEAEAQAKRLDPEGRLTSEQLYGLLRIREEQKGLRFDPTPIVMSLCLFWCSLLGVLAWLWAGDRKGRRLHETLRLMVEKGAEIPPVLLAPTPRARPSDLRRGIILSTSGVGLALFLAVLPDTTGAWGAGVTLLFIGLGQQIVWKLQQGRGVLASALAPEPRV